MQFRCTLSAIPSHSPRTLPSISSLLCNIVPPLLDSYSLFPTGSGLAGPIVYAATPTAEHFWKHAVLTNHKHRVKIGSV